MALVAASRRPGCGHVESLVEALNVVLSTSKFEAQNCKCMFEYVPAVYLNIVSQVRNYPMGLNILKENV